MTSGNFLCGLLWDDTMLQCIGQFQSAGDFKLWIVNWCARLYECVFIFGFMSFVSYDYSIFFKFHSFAIVFYVFIHDFGFCTKKLSINSFIDYWWVFLNIINIFVCYILYPRNKMIFLKYAFIIIFFIPTYQIYFELKIMKK